MVQRVTGERPSEGSRKSAGRLAVLGVDRRFLVEWDVWVAAVRPGNPHHAGCRALVADLLGGRRPGEAAVTDVVLVRAAAELEREPDRSHAEVGRYVEAISTHVEVVSVTAERLRAAAVLSGLMGMELHACCTMKVALDMGIPTIYSTCLVGRRVPGVSVAQPGSE